jgi:hypothetical protein
MGWASIVIDGVYTKRVIPTAPTLPPTTIVLYSSGQLANREHDIRTTALGHDGASGGGADGNVEGFTILDQPHIPCARRTQVVS